MSVRRRFALILVFLTSASPLIATGADKPWLKSLAQGKEEALRLRRPILVRVGAEWCSWCRKEDAEIARSEVQEVLGKWTLVALDADRDEADVRALGVGPIPAFRLLTPTGRAVAEHEGYRPANDLIGWLGSNYEKAAGAAVAELTETGEPSGVAVVRLVRLFDQADAVLREAAVLRLRDHPGIASASVVEAFTKGSLQARLAALELFDAWHAPIEGIDPWQPATLTDARVKILREWAEGAAKGTRRPNVTPERLAAAGREIEEYLKSNADSVVAARERLARFGRSLLPAVLDRLKGTEGDEARERLTALRYRLASSDALTIDWPGGLDRLASRDVATRHRAVDDLMELGSRGEQGLWLELFSDPDPLVRETALRGLNREGSEGSSQALIGLLADPEPNVRAAVLKQLAEHPSPGLAAKMAEYVAKETDPDLLVHAVRVFRAIADAKSLEVLISLLKHENWRIRAEATEAVGKRVERVNGPPAEAITALLDKLEDLDGFVVGRAMAAIRELDQENVVEPLLRVAEKHPDLAPKVIEILTTGSVKSAKAMPKLVKFAGDPNPSIRAAVIGAIGNASKREIEPEVRTGLDDPESIVRNASARALFAKLESIKAIHAATEAQRNAAGGDATLGLESPPALGLPGRLIGALLGSSKPEPPAQEVKKEGETKDAASRHDAWLTSFQEGKEKPSWIEPAVKPLEMMLSSASPEERLRAALPLVAISGHPKAVETLAKVAKERPDLAGEASQALPFRHWDDRLSLFKTLVAVGPPPDEIATLASSIAEVADPRAADPLWSLAARDHLSEMGSYGVKQALHMIHFGQMTQDPKALPRDEKRRILAELRPRAESGSEWQRLIALVLLTSISPEDAASAARGIVGDPGSPPSLRANAFQVLVACQTRDEGRALAVAALGNDDPETRKLALLYLISDSARLQTLREYLSLPYNMPGLQWANNTNRPSSVVLDKILKDDLVRPLLESSDPETAALAGYILALKGDRGGLVPLLAYWKATDLKDETWNRRAVQAIAALDDDAQVSILERLYAHYRAEEAGSNFNNPSSSRDFYWTIRVMTGPIAKKLRKQIRREVGMEVLRQGVLTPDQPFPGNL